MDPKGVRAAALGFSTRWSSISQGRRNPELDPRQRARVHRSRHQSAAKQRRVAAEFTGFERVGLFVMEHSEGRSMCEAPPVDRSAEKEFGGGMEQNSPGRDRSSG